MYIKILHNNQTYGPLHSTTTLRQILTTLRIPPRSNPSLHNLQSPKIYTTESLDTLIDSGVYELVVANPLPWVEGEDDVRLDNRVDVRQKSTQTSQRSEGSLENEDSGRREVAREKVVKSKVEEKVKSEIEIGIEALVHLVASIPPRYVKYNTVLSRRMDEAIELVERLRHSLQLVEKEETNNPSSSPPPTRPKIPITTQKTFIQYRLILLLHQIWSTVWARYAPASRLYHISDMATPQALITAEHCINQIHIWRRTLDAQTWETLKRSSTCRHLVDVARLARRGRFVPRVVELGDERLEGDAQVWGRRGVVEGWEYLSRGKVPEVEMNKENALPVRLDPRETTREIRRLFIDVMRQTGVYRDEEMEGMLDELIKMDEATTIGGKSEDEGRKVDVVYPRAAVKRAIMNEFRISAG
ncbi:hypothetical protein HDV00_006197 [Rhizophlyctis rosea]|nr:hypothetical protein HDV00_006197 [Rhizophlyctis rosea]